MQITAATLREKVNALRAAGMMDTDPFISISVADALYLAELLDLVADELVSSVIPATQTMASLRLSGRTASKLYACGINTMGDLLRYSEYDLARLPPMDNAAFHELMQKLHMANIALQRI